MRRWIPLVAVTIAIIGWSAALVASPLAAAEGHTKMRYAAALTYAAGSIICHQKPERSFHLGGAQLPVCARCMGLYVGAAVGAVFWMGASGIGRDLRSQMTRLLQARVVRLLLLAVALPTIVTVATAAMGWWDPANEVRAWLALPLGGMGGMIVTAAAAGDLR